jgi:DNA mismatch repair protein MutS
METDKTTLNDLSVFQHDDELSIFDKLNFTRTIGGREKLRSIFSKSAGDITAIKNVQKTLQIFLEKRNEWPLSISNGSVTMIYKFYESNIDQMPARPTSYAAQMYKMFHGPDYSLVKYSIGHSFDFIAGCTGKS